MKKIILAILAVTSNAYMMNNDFFINHPHMSLQELIARRIPISHILQSKDRIFSIYHNNGRRLGIGDRVGWGIQNDFDRVTDWKKNNPGAVMICETTNRIKGCAAGEIRIEEERGVIGNTDDFGFQRNKPNLHGRPYYRCCIEMGSD
jgi:hypothetical protein